MNTIRNIVDAFRIYLSDRTGRPSQSISVPNKLIYFEFIGALAKVLSGVEKSEQKQMSPTICMDMEEVDIVECPCAPASGCEYMKSMKEIPTIIGLPLDVSTSDSGNTSTYLDWSNFKHKINSRVLAERNGRYYTLKTIGGEQHLYVYHTKETTRLKTVQFTAIPYDIIEFQKSSCGDTSKFDCNPMDVAVMLRAEDRDTCFAMMFQNIAKEMQIEGTSDNTNNDIADNKR